MIGIDIGGTHLKLVALTPDGTVRVRRNVETTDHPTSAEHNRRTRFAIISDFITETTRKYNARLMAFGVSSPGLADKHNQTTYDLPGKLVGMKNIDWKQSLNLNCPLYVLNDSHASLIAEAHSGAAQGKRHVIMLTLGTGVGGAIISNGRLIQGHNGRAGHIGQMIVDQRAPLSIFNVPGALEWFVGNGTVPQRTNNRFHSAQDIATGYRDGDSEATEYWLQSIEWLAITLASLIHVLDPELIIIGGGIADAEEALFEPLARSMQTYEWTIGGVPVPIVPAVHKTYASAIGAALCAAQIGSIQ